METRKILGIIFSLLFLGAFAFVLSWGIINFNKVKDSMSGTQIYNKEDINKAYQDGYDTALKDKEEYTELINGYRDTITTLNDNISQLNSQVTNLTKDKNDSVRKIEELKEQKTNLQTQVDNLNTIKTNNENTISSLNSQIASLQNKVTTLTNSGEDKSEQIEQLNAQILSLQSLVSQLQTTNNLNVDTITSLNVQIANLNNQISEMTLVSQNSTSQIASLNNKINELQKSVTYYESYIAQLENNEQVVATFEYDGSVYNIQIVNKGSKLSVTAPQSTTYKVFNGWKVDGEIIDLNTYTINANTKIVADITYKFDVKFKVDNEVVDSQIVSQNEFATLPTSPTKNGYAFDGWSLNGVDVISNISSKEVTENTTYIAVFTQLHTVTFIYENETKSTQIVRNGTFASSIDVENTTYKVFNGWQVDDTIVDLSLYKIYSDTTFVANITYKYLVKFYVEDSLYTSQIVTKNSCVVQPASPSKTGYAFKGWSIDGTNIVENIDNKPVTENTEYVALFTKLYTVKFNVGDQTVSVQSVKEGEFVTLPNSPEKQDYEFDGWSINGKDIINNIDSIPTNKNITYVAVFTRLYNVKYYVGSALISQQSIREGSTDYTLEVPKITLDNKKAVYWHNSVIGSSGVIINKTENKFSDYVGNSSSKPAITKDLNFYAYCIEPGYDFYGIYKVTFKDYTFEVLINKSDITKIYYKNGYSFGLKSDMAYNKTAVDYQYNTGRYNGSTEVRFVIGNLTWKNDRFVFDWKTYVAENRNDYAVGKGEFTHNPDLCAINYIACYYTVNGLEVFE